MTAPQLDRASSLDQPASRGIWIFAGTFALICHLAFAAFAIGRMHDDPEEDDLGAPGIEIAFELASTQRPPSDLPPGPENEASVASPPMVEQKSKIEEVNLPKETPVEAEEPDRLVALEHAKKPEEEEPEVKPTVANPSTESLAQDAMAAPTIENAPEAPISTTRDQGTGESRQRVRLTWQKELLAHLSRYKRYPAERTHRSAEILVTFNLDRTGNVLSATVAKSSGDTAFDSAAVAMLQRANPVPAPPPLIADEGLSFSLPVIFRKHGK